MFDPALISYIAVMSITPGPNNLMLASSGVRFGMRPTWPHVLGISAGLAIQVFIATTLLALVLESLARIRLPLAMAGCTYLLWLSWQIARSGTPDERRVARPMSFIGAALFQWLNPKAWVMVINTAVLFMPAGGSTTPHLELVALALICAVVNLPCIAVWAITGDRLRHWLSSPRGLLLFNGVMSVLMAGTAIALLLDEWRHWPGAL